MAKGSRLLVSGRNWPAAAKYYRSHNSYNYRTTVYFRALPEYTICMRKNTYIYSRTCVYNVNYHLVWCVKYRNKVLTPEIASRLEQVLVDIGNENGFTVVSAKAGDSDHVHCFISAPPKLSITFIAKHLKGTSAIRLFKEFPELRETLKKHQLWNPSYFVETIGSTSEENICRYIESQ